MNFAARKSKSSLAINRKLTELNEFNGDDCDPDIDYDFLYDGDEFLDEGELEKLTVTQLRQQLRVRGKRVGGNKAELIKRLRGISQGGENKQGMNRTKDILEIPSSSSNNTESKARRFAKSRGKEFIDVSEYLDEEDVGKKSKTTKDVDSEILFGEEETQKTDNDVSPETWGDEAKIVDDYEGRSIVVDGLSRTIVEFRGSNKISVKAYVVASRDSLKEYLAGGNRGIASEIETEEAVKNIQVTKERQSKLPIKFEDEQGEDIDDEEGHYTNVLDRDYGDWGKYSMTGVQMSAKEVKGVLLLSDVRGPFCDDIQILADKIAFECQPAVVFAPDLFRGKPWKQDNENPGFNNEGDSYEQWRSCHSDGRVSVDIRAAAAALREQFGVSSISLFGTCYGGGRALEATAREYPYGSIDDENGEKGPPHVDPSTCVVWYPTRYNPEALFGREGILVDENDRPCTAVMAIFAGNDKIPGATTDDAAKLKACLEDDKNINDHMVKVFGGQEHGFAHVGVSEKTEKNDSEDNFIGEEFGGPPSRVSSNNDDAEVASLLSTAWLETYSRQFLPTTGEAVKDNEVWSDLKMQDLPLSGKRDIRAEIEKAIEDHQDVELDLQRMHPDDFKTPIDDMENMDEKLRESMKTQTFGASIEDDADAFLDKLEAALDREDFNSLPGFGDVPLDDSVDGNAYW